MKKIIFLLAVLFSFTSQTAEISDFAIKDNKILYKNKELHPGCLRQISSQLNGDAVSLIVNIDFEKPNGQFVGRGCMNANQYDQNPFMRNDYFTYVYDEKNLKEILKNPKLSFDGFGYKLSKNIDDKIFVVDIREFTTGSADFLTTLVVEVVENLVFKITPDGKTVSGTVVGLKKIGEILKGTVNWNEKLNEALKMHKQFKNKSKNKSDII